MSRAEPRESGRIVALDVARGFALLGIFLVNIDFFALPLGAVAEGGRPEGTLLDRSAWWLVTTFALGKFYPLFSILFGVGLVLQREAIESRSSGFVPIYLRRTFPLMALGLAHGIFVWYGDILFIYSGAALVLLACSRLSGRWLLGLAAASVVVSMLLTGAMGALGVALGGMSPPATEETAASGASPAGAEQGRAASRPFREWLELAPEMAEGPADPRWMELETRAYREGGFFDVLGFRVVSFVGMLVSMAFGGGWHVLGMFFLGAGLYRTGVLDPAAAPLRLRLLGIAAVLGVPLAFATAVLRLVGDHGAVVAATLNYVAGPAIGLAYLLGWFVLVDRRKLRRLTGGLASTGRMALTHYLSQSIIASVWMYYWGLGRFGTVDQFARDLFVVVVFALQVGFSVFWMSRFRFGPLEWLWRSATYRRVQPLRRG